MSHNNSSRGVYYKQVLYGEDGLNANTFLVIKYFKDKLRIWSLSYTLYFNLISNISIVSIWSITFCKRSGSLLRKGEYVSTKLIGAEKRLELPPRLGLGTI